MEAEVSDRFEGLRLEHIKRVLVLKWIARLKSKRQMECSQVFWYETLIKWLLSIAALWIMSATTFVGCSSLYKIITTRACWGPWETVYVECGATLNRRVRPPPPLRDKYGPLRYFVEEMRSGNGTFRECRGDKKIYFLNEGSHIYSFVPAHGRLYVCSLACQHNNTPIITVVLECFP